MKKNEYKDQNKFEKNECDNSEYKDKNRKIYLIIITLLLIVCLIAIILFWYKYSPYCNSKNHDKAMDAVSDINNTKILINKGLEQTNEYYSVLDKYNEELTKIDNRIKYVNNDHASKKRIKDLNENILNMFDGDLSMFYYDEEKINSKLDVFEDSVQTIEGLIDDISELKEDKINKTSDTVVIDNSTYFSSLGLTNEFKELFDCIYPVGSVYISVAGQLPLYGTWQKLQNNTTLWSTANGGGGYLSPTLPNVKGSAGSTIPTWYNISNPFARGSSADSKKISGNTNSIRKINFDLSRANGIYQNGATVRPPAVAVTMFKRID